MINHQASKDIDPGDGKFEMVIGFVPSLPNYEYFSNDLVRFKTTVPATQRMREIWTRIQEAAKEPLKAHDAVWQRVDSIERFPWESVRQSFDDKLIVPLPEDPESLENDYRIYDDNGYPLP